MTPLLLVACLLPQADDLLRTLEDDDPDVRAVAGAAILRMGPRVIPDLERALGHPSSEVRGRAADLLARFPEYALRSILKNPEYPAVRRLWNAVIEAAIWKRPLPREVWTEISLLEGEKFRSRSDRVRRHTEAEILTELSRSARGMLRSLSRRVGVEGFDPEQVGGGLQKEIRERDFLSFVLEAEPDAETFEEVYGTLQSVHLRGWLPDWERWCEEDWRIAMAILVQIRRRPEAPVMKRPGTREQALELALRGPIVRGMADALGRAFSNRGRGYQESLSEKVLKETPEHRELAVLREVYGILLELDGEIGRHFYTPGLLVPARAAIPEREAPVPDRHRALFDKVREIETSAAALRVVREILENLGEVEGSKGGTGTAAALLREVGVRVAAGAAYK